MAGLDYDILTGELSVDASPTGHLGTFLSLHNPAWLVVDLRDLWFPGLQRGADLIIPGVPGVRARQRRVTVTTHSLPTVITGDANVNGIAPACGADFDAAFDNRMRQLKTNIDLFVSVFVVPTGTGDGTRAARLVLPDGETRTADIHVTGFTPGGRVDVLQTGTLEISIPAGAFA